MKFLLSLSLVAVLLMSTGCATILSKSEYTVNLSSNPSGAKVKVMDSSGQTVFTGTTPTMVSLEAGDGYFKGSNYMCTFEKPGYGKATAQIGRNIDLWYVAGNFVFGGLIGWLIVDPITGAMWTLDGNLHVDLTSQSSSMDIKSQTFQVVALNDVPEHLRNHMIPVCTEK